MNKNQIIRTFQYLILVSNLVAANLPAQDTTAQNKESFNMIAQDLIKEYVDDSNGVGAAVAIIEDGEIRFFVYGKKSFKRHDLISEDTIFEIGSITKVFTAMILMDMVIKQQVQLVNPIEMYLPDIKIPDYAGKKITLRHLATHTSGFPRMPSNFAPKDPSNPFLDYKIESLYSYLNNCSLTKAPGESFEYSNIGMGLLGHILSLRLGKSYEILIQDLITEHLNMTNTFITLDSSKHADFASGHHLQKEVSHWDIPGLMGAGALRSTIKDMANFLAANMIELESPVNNILQQCHKKQYSPMSGFSVGLGWLLSNSNNTEIIWHNGGTGGFRSYIGFNPKAKRGIVILANSTEDWPDEFGLLMLDPNYQRPVIDKALANDSDYLNRFAGSYEATLTRNSSKQKLEISVFGKLLGSALSGGEVGMLYPKSFYVFGVKGFPDGEVHFILNPSGDIEKVKASLISSGILLWEAIPCQKAE